MDGVRRTFGTVSNYAECIKHGHQDAESWLAEQEGEMKWYKGYERGSDAYRFCLTDHLNIGRVVPVWKGWRAEIELYDTDKIIVIGEYPRQRDAKAAIEQWVKDNESR